jgi:hypothetical protein
MRPEIPSTANEVVFVMMFAGYNKIIGKSLAEELLHAIQP